MMNCVPQQQNQKGQIMKIKGGKKGFIKAIEEGFESNCHNPTLYYSKDDGFYIASGLIPNRDHEVSLMFYWASTGQKCLRPCDYEEVKQEILEAIRE
jgi:hypothetical protein